MNGEEEVTRRYTYSIPSSIDVRTNYGIKIISYIYGSLTIEPKEIPTDIDGKVELQKTGVVEYGFPCSLEIDKIWIDDDCRIEVDGRTKIEYSFYKNNILKGRVKYTKEKANRDISGHIFYIPNVEKDVKGHAFIKEERLDKSIRGKISYQQGESQTDIGGHALIEGIDVGKELSGSLTYEGNGILEHYLDGKLLYETNEGNYDLQGKCKVNKENEYKDIMGNLTYNKEDEEITIVEGKCRVYEYYRAKDVPCRILVKKRCLCECIMARIEVPPSSKVNIPCTIMVDDHNYFGEIKMEGTITIEKEDLNVDMISGSCVLLPTIHADIDCSTSIESVYTRREFNASVNVATSNDKDFDATIKVKENPLQWFWSEILYSTIIVGTPKSILIDSKIDVQGEKEEEKTVPNPHPLPKARIAILVSPIWRYEPFVLKGSLVTLLDRYYRKVDLDIVYGGQYRGDFDIYNLAKNYKIKDENLFQVPIKYDYNNLALTYQSLDRFIYHMSERQNGYPLNRVFIYLNNPTYYMNEPISRVIDWCITNNVSCVGISASGAYCEYLTQDKIRDEMIKAIEMDKYQRHQGRRVEYINMRLPKYDPRLITF
jgi:hypothetical protein